VAAQIHVAYEKLFSRLDEGTGTDLGWRFLEKMVQLPLALPEPQRPQVERFVDSIMAVQTEGRVAELDEEAPEVVAARREIREAADSATLDAIPEALEEVKAKHEGTGTASPNLDAVLQKAARLEFVSQFSDAAAREMLVRYAFDLSGNPREIKRFVNLFRFYAYIDFWRKTQGLDTPGPDGAGKLARIAISWPHLLTALGHSVSRNGKDEALLVWLEEAASDDDEWAKAVAAAPKRVQPQLGESRELRDVMARAPFVGASGVNFI
jgi:hypothetical protein